MSAPCGACGGSGRYDSDGSPPCGACDGTGSIDDCDDCDRASDEMERLRRELDDALAKFELLDHHRRSDNELIDRLMAALSNLIESVMATKTRDTIVLRDLDAARAVLGGRS
jgi:RecJ-like exonuclease